MRVVKSFAREAFEQQRICGLMSVLQSRREEYGSEAWLYNGVVAFTQLLASPLWFGAQRILGGMLDLADLVTYLLYVGILIEPIRTALNFVGLYREGMTGFERFWEMSGTPTPPAPLSLQHPRSTQLQKPKLPLPPPSTRSPQNLSLNISAGETLALVSLSGVGKSTLCALIPVL
ncbi:MAG: hypothetical protein R2865_15985 [Deinococcales bacterium]